MWGVMKMRKNNGGAWITVFAAVIMVLVVITSLSIFGGIDSANIQNETIIEEDLAAIGIPADAECLTYDAASQGFDWDACGAGGLPNLPDDNVWVGNGSGVATDTAVVDCNNANVNRQQYDTATNVWGCDTDLITSVDILDDDIAAIDIITGGVRSIEILDDTILPVDLHFTGSETDEFCVTIETTGPAFEAQECGGVGIPDIGFYAQTGSGHAGFPGFILHSDSTKSMVTNRLYYHFGTVLESIQISELVVEVTIADATSSNARICVYEANNDFSISGQSLIIQETFSVTTTGEKTMIINSGTPYTLNAGNYVVIIASDKTVSYRTMDYLNYNAPLRSTISSTIMLYTATLDDASQVSGGCDSPGVDDAASHTWLGERPEFPVFVTISGH